MATVRLSPTSSCDPRRKARLPHSTPADRHRHALAVVRRVHRDRSQVADRSGRASAERYSARTHRQFVKEWSRRLATVTQAWQTYGTGFIDHQFTGTTSGTEWYFNNADWYSTSSGNTGNTWMMRRPRLVTVQGKITFAEFDTHPDPDALLGEHYEKLMDTLERELCNTTNPERIEDIWRTWVVRARCHEDYEEGCEHLQLTAVWQEWANSTPRYTGQAAVTRPRAPLLRVPTPEERARARWQRHQDGIIRHNRTRSRVLRAKVANRRAHELLLEHLDEEQRADLERANGFKVIVSGRTYWIARGYAGNVYLLDEFGQRRYSYCIHASTTLPDPDQMLSQKLLLESDEETFLRIANRNIA